jgi:hypothetical protein
MRNMKSDYTNRGDLKKNSLLYALARGIGKEAVGVVPAKHAVETVFLANLTA